MPVRGAQAPGRTLLHTLRGPSAGACATPATVTAEVVTMKAKDAVGRYGENVAATYLARCGWEVVDRNWRGASGEIDIVALQGDDLVVVEVKTRSGDGFGHPAEAVTPVKLARLRRLAAQWLDAHELHPRSVRIDVIAVRTSRHGPARVEHLAGVC